MFSISFDEEFDILSPRFTQITLERAQMMSSRVYRDARECYDTYIDEQKNFNKKNLAIYRQEDAAMKSHLERLARGLPY